MDIQCNLTDAFRYQNETFKCFFALRITHADVSESQLWPKSTSPLSQGYVQSMQGKEGQERTAQHCHLVPGKLEPGTRLLTNPRTCSAFKLWQVFETRCFILNYERLQLHLSLRTSKTNPLNKNNQSELNQHVRQQLLIIFAIVTA